MTALRLAKSGVLHLTEADVTRQCVDYLTAEGWRCIRLESELVTGASGKPKRIGETGMPDYVAIWSDMGLDLFFLELKAPGKKPRRSQLEWHSQARDDGFDVCVADSLECLKDWLKVKR